MTRRSSAIASTMTSYWSSVQPCTSMARFGQALTHMPQPTQFAGVTTARCTFLSGDGDGLQ